MHKRQTAAVVFLLVIGAMVLAVFAPVASAASTITVTGVVHCANNSPVTGIWIDSTGGGSGFASWQVEPGSTNNSVALYSRTFPTNLPTNINLHVGCGGSPAAWWSDNREPSSYPVGGSQTLNVECYEAPGVGNRCAWPNRPRDWNALSYNWFAAGYCTWYAAQLWHDQGAGYPNWSGDAKYWAANAASKGWLVRSWPRARSILVIQPGYAGIGDSRGHVAWVNSISISGATMYLNVTDMNNPTFNRVANHTFVFNPAGMQFIIAP